MTKIVTQNLGSGSYEIHLEPVTTIDITSYVYSRYGTFKIIPVSSDTQSFEALERYDVTLNDLLIGSVSVVGYSGTFSSDVAYAMASAIDIVTDKINELLDKEERHILAQLASDMIDAVDLTEEQKAMYRTFLLENGTLDDVISELENPTDISAYG